MADDYILKTCVKCKIQIRYPAALKEYLKDSLGKPVYVCPKCQTDHKPVKEGVNG